MILIAVQIRKSVHCIFLRMPDWFLLMKMTITEKLALTGMCLAIGVAFYFGFKISSAVMRAEAESTYSRD